MENIIYASKFGASLDSDVSSGGGTDDTRILQAALDTAREKGHLRLVVDGAALISAPLSVYSNTTIFFPDSGCGLYLKDGSNCCLIKNAHWDIETVRDENIAILGGTFNHNACGQIHDHGEGDAAKGNNPLTSLVIGFEFYGVRSLTVRDVIIRNQRTFGMLLANWEHVLMENVFIDLRDYMPGNNQDGLHFFGPGRHLTLRNIYGRSGDDFIALAPDEVDLKSSITDVMIDGVTLMDADQGIRLLCRGDGRLDRVNIRGVTGTFRGYGFFINPWFDSAGGHFGSIMVENVDLKPVKPAYNYRPPFLFCLGGDIENLILKDIRWHKPEYPVQLIVAGGSYNLDKPESPAQQTHIHRLTIDGLSVDVDNAAAPTEYILIRSRVDSLTVRRVGIQSDRRSELIRIIENGSVGEMRLNDISLQENTDEG